MDTPRPTPHTSHIGLFFGSFNPVHIGHLIIAQTFLNELKLDAVWFVLSPHNPLKDKKDLWPDEKRLEILKLAIAGNSKFEICNVELELPQPSYTINTLQHLQAQYPGTNFQLLIGSDNLENFALWKDYEHILANYKIGVYMRPEAQKNAFFGHENVQIVNAPLLDISSTQIREFLQEKKSVRYLVPDAVFEYLNRKNND